MTLFAFWIASLTLFLAFFDGMCGMNCGSESPFYVATFALVVLTVLPAWVAFHLVKRDPLTIWTPAVAFLLGTTIFFGLGSASTLFADAATRSFLVAGNWGLSAGGLIRTQILTGTGIAVTALSMGLFMRLRYGSSGSDHPAVGARRQVPTPVIATFFIAVGLPLKYAIVLPAQFGMIDVNLSGAVINLVHLLDLGLATAMYLAVRGRRFWLLIFVLVWVPHLALSLLEFSKKTITVAILLPALGAFLAHRRWTKLLPWAAFAALSFIFLQDVNTIARYTLLKERGTYGAVGFSDRVAMMDRILSGEITLSEASGDARADAQGAWLRLNYSGPQLRAMELYDRGHPGEWTLTPAFLVPRFLWPEKPIVNGRGQTFTQIVTGNPDATSRTGITVYADGYWTMGWSGVILFCAFMGAILGIFNRLTYQYVSRRSLIYLPVILLAIQAGGYGPMGFLQSSIVGPLAISVSYLLLISLLRRIWFSLEDPVRRVNSSSAVRS